MKCLIFDLDGTLVNSDPTVIKIINKIKQDNNLTFLNPIPNFKYALSQGGIEMFYTLFGKQVDVDKYLEIFRKNYLNFNLKDEKLFSGVFKLLEILKKNNYIITLLTNKPKTLTFKVLEYHKLTNFFDLVVTSNDAKKKPSINGVKKILKHYKVSLEDVYMIGDSVFDSITANKAGIKFLYFHESGYKDNEQIIYYRKFDNYKNFIGLINE